MKYKVGDLVKILENPWIEPGIKGEILNIDQQTPTLPYMVKIEYDSVIWLGDRHLKLYAPYLDKKDNP